MADDYEFDVKGDHLRSYIFDTEIRHGCRQFSLTIWAYFEFHPAGVVSYRQKHWNVGAWFPGEPERFKQEFAKQIRDGWGNGAIWLVHGKKGLKDLWCDVQIIPWENRSDAHMVVRAVKTPVCTTTETFVDPDKGPYQAYPPFAAGCYPLARSKDGKSNPIDMTIEYEAVILPPQNPPPADAGRSHEGTDDKRVKRNYYQQVVQHEFGHYLKLTHACQAADKERKFTPEAYCENQTDMQLGDIMAKGNKFYGQRVGIPFRRQLDKHGYVNTKVEAWVCKGHTHTGGGVRDRRPWPDGHFPKVDTLTSDPHWHDQG